MHMGGSIARISGHRSQAQGGAFTPSQTDPHSFPTEASTVIAHVVYRATSIFAQECSKVNADQQSKPIWVDAFADYTQKCDDVPTKIDARRHPPEKRDGGQGSVGGSGLGEIGEHEGTEAQKPTISILSGKTFAYA